MGDLKGRENIGKKATRIFKAKKKNKEGIKSLNDILKKEVSKMIRPDFRDYDSHRGELMHMRKRLISIEKPKHQQNLQKL